MAFTRYGRPYSESHHNREEQIVASCAAGILLCGVIFYTGAHTNDAIAHAVFICTSLVIGVMFIAMAIFVLRAWKLSAAEAASNQKPAQSDPTDDQLAGEPDVKCGSTLEDAALHFLSRPSSGVPLRSMSWSSHVQSMPSFLADVDEDPDDEQKSHAARASPGTQSPSTSSPVLASSRTSFWHPWNIFQNNNERLQQHMGGRP